jgi:hypothetical protein
MFKLAVNPTFKHEVKVHSPVDGGYKVETIRATYNLLSTEEAKAFDLSSPDGTSAFLKRVIARLDDIVDDNERPMPHSDELRDRVIVMPHVRVALWRGYFDAIANDPKAGN